MHKKIVLYSLNDPAGRNIAGLLRENYSVEDIKGVGDVLHMTEAGVDEDTLYIVASRHVSKSGKPALTCHSPGNFSGADYGGSPRELSYAPAIYLREALGLLRSRQEEENLGYEVSFECTHHGPTALKSPIMFVEVGSTEREWGDLAACGAVAYVINELLNNTPPEEGIETAIALGGGHYCRRFSRVEGYAIGHICPKYNLRNLGREMLEEMISKTVPKPSVVLVERKGLGKEKNRVMGLLEETGLKQVVI